jgi:RNA polymerase sigma-70 factor (ECF subfamily)
MTFTPEAEEPAVSDGAERKGSAGSADIHLARKIAGGDREAFATLMRGLNGRLYRTARSIVPNDLRAERALESAWLRAYRSIGNFGGETSLSIWLMRIVVGEALASLREAPIAPRRARDGEVIAHTAGGAVV